MVNLKLDSIFTFSLLVFGTIIGIAATDLILPAIPSLPNILVGGNASNTQLVLAIYTAGAGIGLLLFGELGARFDQRLLLILSLLMFSIISILCTFSLSLKTLIIFRFFQGMFGSAAATFAPGMIRALYNEKKIIKMFGILGSIESLTPALAPIVGLWLFQSFGWKSTFYLLFIMGFILAICIFLKKHHLPKIIIKYKNSHGYKPLLKNLLFLRYMLSHAFTFSSLIVFVFCAPVIIINSLSGNLSDFIIMQIAGITIFIIASNISVQLTKILVPNIMIFFGTIISLFGGILMVLYSCIDIMNIKNMIIISMILNAGLGFRGPPGFCAAILAANGDDSRASALIIVTMLMMTSGGSILIAPFINHGVITIAIASVIFSGLAMSILIIPKKKKYDSK